MTRIVINVYDWCDTGTLTSSKWWTRSCFLQFWNTSPKSGMHVSITWKRHFSGQLVKFRIKHPVNYIRANLNIYSCLQKKRGFINWFVDSCMHMGQITHLQLTIVQLCCSKFLHVCVHIKDSLENYRCVLVS